MNKKIIMSGLSILATLALVGGGAFALFTSTATSSGNVFGTGTLALKLSDINEFVQSSVTASFGGNLAPGQCTGNQTLNLQNTGTLSADHAEVTVSNVVTDSNNNASPDMDSYLTVDTLQYDGGNVISQLTDLNGNGRLDLADWAANPNVLDNLSLTNLNTDHPLVLNVCFDSSAGDTLQADSVSSTFSVILNQSASQ